MPIMDYPTPARQTDVFTQVKMLNRKRFGTTNKGLSTDVSVFASA